MWQEHRLQAAWPRFLTDPTFCFANFFLSLNTTLFLKDVERGAVRRKKCCPSKFFLSKAVACTQHCGQQCLSPSARCVFDVVVWPSSKAFISERLPWASFWLTGCLPAPCGLPSTTITACWCVCLSVRTRVCVCARCCVVHGHSGFHRQLTAFLCCPVWQNRPLHSANADGACSLFSGGQPVQQTTSCQLMLFSTPLTMHYVRQKAHGQ